MIEVETLGIIQGDAFLVMQTDTLAEIKAEKFSHHGV